MSPPKTVLLVEDDAPTRERLASVISGHPGLTLLASVGNCADAFAALGEGTPDVMLTDLGLPDGHGNDLIKAVGQRHPTVSCLVITVFGDEKHVIEAIAAGASGYLLKDGNADAIGKAIMQVTQGGVPISAAIGRYLLNRIRHPEPIEVQQPLTLSQRELEVLQEVELGYSYKEIAERLDVSFHTVNTHIKRIYEKLQVHSKSAAVRAARSQGLLSG